MQSSIAGATIQGQSLPALVKTAKVIGVHRSDHSVDVAFLDGSTAQHVPVISGWLGSTHGAVGLTAPTYDPATLAKKTYPTAGGQITEPATNPSHVGRDQYAAVLQMEGYGLGTSGYVCVGFFAPQVNEMLFPHTFEDLLLVRHSSDVQTTVEKDGRVSIQHPSGTRITIGTGPTDLTKKDYDERYEIRHNTDALKDVEAIAMGAEEVEAALLLQTAGYADLYGKMHVKLHTKTATRVEMDEGGTIEVYAKESITLHVDGGAQIVIAGSDILIEAPGTVTVRGSEITLN